MCFGVDNPFLVIEKYTGWSNLSMKNQKIPKRAALYKDNDDLDWENVYRTEILWGKLTPFWKPFNLKMKLLCNDN